MFPVAFPYKRFSQPSQEDGDSIRRQNAVSFAWSERTGVAIDTTLTLEDRGVSGLRGVSRSDPDRYALAAFLRGIETGRVQRGDYLLVENFDRLTREQEVPATHLLTSILMTGVKVVQLVPSELELTDKSDAFAIMRAVLEMSRGHGESAIKSVRVAEVKAQHRRLAAEGRPITGKRTGRVRYALTSRLPAWLELDEDGKPRVIAHRGEVVKHIFSLAGAGYGYGLIVKQLSEAGTPAFCGRVAYTDGQGRARTRAADGKALGSGKWTRAYVAAILGDRRAVGELQPRLRDGTPAGDILRIPAVVSDAEWLKAREGADERRKKPGRVSADHVNVFSHLVTDARTGSSYNSTLRRDGHRVTGHNKAKPPHRVLITYDATEGRAPVVSFPLDAFEGGVLSLLAEIDPKDVAGEDTPDEVSQLAGQKAEVRAKVERLMAAVEAELDAGEQPSQGTQRLLKKLEAEEKRLEEQLRKARQAAVCPRGEAWAEAVTLMGLAADPESRLRLRSLLRQNVTEIRLLVVPRKRERIAAVQVFFASGTSRTYLIHAWAALVTGSLNRPGGWRAASLPPAVMESEALDLRDPRHVAGLEQVLGQIDLTLLAEALQPGPAGG
jgi:DNA invertase Pin-like site-specific DNA recombinase